MHCSMKIFYVFTVTNFFNHQLLALYLQPGLTLIESLQIL